MSPRGEALSENDFTFNVKFYIQNYGLVMEFPISGILPDIYLNIIEISIFFCKKKYKNKNARILGMWMTPMYCTTALIDI